MTAGDAARIRAQGLPVGTFHIDVRARRWDVSRTALEMCGVPAGADLGLDVVTALLEDGDRATVSALVTTALREHRPFSLHRELARSDGSACWVGLVGEGAYAGDALVAVHGHVVDLTGVLEERLNERLDQAVSEVVAHRASIEQAKGALALTYGFDEDAAMLLLRRWSSRRNIKVNVLAERLVQRASGGFASTPRLRAAVESVLDQLPSASD